MFFTKKVFCFEKRGEKKGVSFLFLLLLDLLVAPAASPLGDLEKKDSKRARSVVGLITAQRAWRVQSSTGLRPTGVFLALLWKRELAKVAGEKSDSASVFVRSFVRSSLLSCFAPPPKLLLSLSPPLSLLLSLSLPPPKA